ncbi:MAG: hypothetical protein HYY06_06020 [Deltaproteobacteria bacterium]|nr:hypothetical protein [Deltaproteobacteria bacterium]
MPKQLKTVSSNDKSWGHCQNCNYFASPARIPLPTEEAHCNHPELKKFELVVFGASGCSGFRLRQGLPVTVEEPAAGVSPA